MIALRQGGIMRLLEDRGEFFPFQWHYGLFFIYVLKRYGYE